MRFDVRKGLLATLVAALGIGGCTEFENAMASLETLNFMHESPALDPYEGPRNAPPMSVPVESPGGVWEPPVERTESALVAWGDTLTNPLGMDDAVLNRGARAFQTYCAVCHGTAADGTGPVVGPGKIPFATNLTLPATAARTDGYLYAVIRVGRGLMPSYQRIHPRDRWAVVNYIRHLQDGGDPMPVELPGLVQPGRDQSGMADADGTGTDTAGRE